MKKVKCILLIDDDETTNFINELMISEMDITDQILQAQNGKEGIDLLLSQVENKQCLPEVILLDINMPVMDGFEFLEEYQKLDIPGKSSVVIVMLTTSLHPTDMERTKNAGITDYINKPLKENSIKQILEKHLS
jgi:CheY-like chemotaxis protein